MCKECENQQNEAVECECEYGVCGCACECHHQKQESPMKDMIEVRRKTVWFTLAFDLIAIAILTVLAVFL